MSRAVTACLSFSGIALALRGGAMALICALCFVASASAQDGTPRLVLALSPSIPAAPQLAPDEYADPADPRPSTGTGLIVAGWISAGIGLLNLATLPVCYADFYPREAEDTCVVLSAAIAGIGLGLGVPFLIIGYNQRADYKAWKERHGAAGYLQRTQLALRNDGALLVYRGEL